MIENLPSKMGKNMGGEIESSIVPLIALMVLAGTGTNISDKVKIADD